MLWRLSHDHFAEQSYPPSPAAIGDSEQTELQLSPIVERSARVSVISEWLASNLPMRREFR
jgi:hypothetical protein